ncbi:MAG: aminopeptidase P family protein [Deltaproteobacteria bacterium]|nr:aminopeptidase P family protein [Deltaproteobacteria bacterium]
MEKHLYKQRIAALRQGLKEQNTDAAWIFQPENRRYLSGFKAEDTQFTESSGSLLIREGRNLLVTDSRYAQEAEKEAGEFEVYTLKQGFSEEFPQVVHGTGTRNLGFEADYVTWGLHRQLTESFDALSPPVRLAPLNGLVETMREVKHALEIEAMAASADMMSEILAKVIDGLKPGLTEKEVAWTIEGLAREAGADGMAFPSIVASGPNGALPHAEPTNRKLNKGEPVILDVGVKLKGYCCDMTRTVFLGEPTPYFKKIYRTVRDAQLRALKEIRPGVESTLPDSAARKVIQEAGFGEYFGHSLGHGVGLATHEGPRLGPRKPVTLKKGMVVTVEPGIYIPHKGGVRLEEMVVIEDTGPRILTKNDCFYAF